MRKKKKKKKKLKKNNHLHKIVFTWFGNLPTSMELQRFHYYQRKIQSAATVFFSLSKTRQQQQTLIIKNGFYILCTGLQWATKRAKPPLHGLSLRKSLIKNHTTLFKSGRVINWIKHKLGFTKTNKSPTWRLVQSPTSTTILQKAIPHPYNSSSCP